MLPNQNVFLESYIKQLRVSLNLMIGLYMHT